MSECKIFTKREILINFEIFLFYKNINLLIVFNEIRELIFSSFLENHLVLLNNDFYIISFFLNLIIFTGNSKCTI